MIYLIFFAHYIGDFLVQTNWMASNKSKSIKALGAHIFTYTLCLMPFGIFYAVVNGAVHMGIDAITSKLSSKFYKEKNIKAFWAVIGFDQMLHAFTLIYTMEILK